MKLHKSIIRILGLLIIVLTLKSCGGSYESENREELASSFEDQFGFLPPNSVKEIKVKNWALYDTDAYWISFTYDYSVMEKITTQEQQLNIALKNTSEFKQIIESIKENAHNPKWLELPNENTNQIYYKKNFIEQTSLSEYYLWVNSKSGITYLYIHSF